MTVGGIVSFKLLIFFFISSIILAQEYQLVKDNVTDEMMIVGISSREVYQDENFSSWFNSEYTNYSIDAKLMDQNKNKFEGKLIKVVLGTWCSDSQREVPRFVKILDFLNFPSDKVLFINVNREKIGLSNEVEGLGIDFVPTFIIYENGEELGRIIETPENSLEEDLIKFVM